MNPWNHRTNKIDPIAIALCLVSVVWLGNENVYACGGAGEECCWHGGSWNDCCDTVAGGCVPFSCTSCTCDSGLVSILGLCTPVNPCVISPCGPSCNAVCNPLCPQYNFCSCDDSDPCVCNPCGPTCSPECNPTCSSFNACACAGLDACICDPCGSGCSPECNPICPQFDACGCTNDVCNPLCWNFNPCECASINQCLCNTCYSSQCEPQCNPLCPAFDLTECLGAPDENCFVPPDPVITTVHVSQDGSQSPNGTTTSPYHSLNTGLCKAQPGDTITLHGGKYRETMTINEALTLKTTNGVSTIGQVNGIPATTFKVLTYNTHLFGQSFALSLGGWPLEDVTFEDYAELSRAIQFGIRAQEENADVIGFDEVWDANLAGDIKSWAGTSTYPYSYYSTAYDEPNDVLNSGLLLLSKYPLHEVGIEYYDDAFAEDILASKGFIHATINKGAFQFGIILTHMQAEQAYASPMSAVSRRGQMIQLKQFIDNYRLSHPNAEVIVMGDLNVIGEDCEYIQNLLPLTGLMDAQRNAPCFDPQDFTFNPETNDLISYFSDSTEGERLDYVLYSRFGAHNMIPAEAVVREYKSPILLNDQGFSTYNLSDHYGLMVQFNIFD